MNGSLARIPGVVVNKGAAGRGKEAGDGSDDAKDYAWHPTHGYQGLLLHTISPRLADRLFPVITSPAAEAVLNLIVVLGLVASSLPLFFRSVPAPWVHACALLFLPSLQRLALLDQRLFRLQLRQFETIYLLANFLAGYPAGVLLAKAEAKAWTHYMCLNGVTVLFLDSLRTPTWVTLRTAAGYSLVFAFWGVVVTGRLGIHFNYDATFSADSQIRVAPFVVGRLTTFAVFAAKYTVRLVLYPDCYVTLKRPVSVATGAAILDSTSQVVPLMSSASVAPEPQQEDKWHSGAGWEVGRVGAMSTAQPTIGADEPPPSPRPDEDSVEAAVTPPAAAPGTGKENGAWAAEGNDLLKTRGPSAYLSPEAGGTVRRGRLLAEVLLPEWHASVLCRALASDTAGYVSLGLLGLAGFFTMLAILFHTLPVSLVYGGFLVYLPTLRFLLLVDLQVLRRLMGHFETAYLLVNLALLLYGVSGDRLYTRPVVAVTATHICLNSGFNLLLDSVRLNPRAKLQIPGYYAPLTIGLVLMSSLRLDLYMDYDKQISAAGLRTLTISFVVGRAATLGPFFAKNLLNLWLRPEVYVVISEPLSRHDDSHLMVSTLRTLAGVTASSTRAVARQTETLII